MRLDQTKGCVLPRLPPGGTVMNCSYSDNLKIVCNLKCQNEKVSKQIYCYLHYGNWQGDFFCNNKDGNKIMQKPIQKLMQCRHKVRDVLIIKMSQQFI